MKIIFTGVGEAFDQSLPNTSILVLSRSGNRHCQILLDCGFTAAHAFWQHSPDPLTLDVIWISHFHGDHFFGLPLLLLRFWEEKRTRPLTIIGQKGIQEKVTTAMELAYPGFYTLLSFEIMFIEARIGENLNLFDLNFSFALGRHSLQCMGLRLDDKGDSLYYSGDGRPSEATTTLAQGCDLVIHEAYGIEPILPAHGSVEGCITFGRKTGARHLALVHMNRNVRKNHAASVCKKLAALADIHAFLPAPGDSLTTGESPGFGK